LVAGQRRDGRRTDTRARIHQVALQVFAERGWEAATLREIADRLGITRPALYYHFTSKEDILASIHRELAGSVDEIIEWTRGQFPDAQARAHVLQRMSALMSGTWGPFMHFAQRDEGAMRNLKAATEFIERMDVLATFLRPDNSITGRIKARLALDALFMADARSEHLGGSATARRKAALATALELVA
jgi:AcrR family transcriptional regulator